MAESSHSERRLAELLEALPPAPSAWVEAAKELPRMRSEIDGIVDRAARDTAYRKSVATAIEKALTEAPEGADRETLEALRERLGAIGDRERDDG
jgi:hypothetical protein